MFLLLKLFFPLFFVLLSIFYLFSPYPKRLPFFVVHVDPGKDGRRPTPPPPEPEQTNLSVDGHGCFSYH